MQQLHKCLVFSFVWAKSEFAVNMDGLRLYATSLHITLIEMLHSAGMPRMNIDEYQRRGLSIAVNHNKTPFYGRLTS